jgi:hypothetical protein
MTMVGIINMGVNTSLFNKLDIHHQGVNQTDNYLEDFPEICGLAGSTTDRLVQKHIQETIDIVKPKKNLALRKKINLLTSGYDRCRKGTCA